MLVTRDYGRQVLIEKSLDDLTESETAMRVLDQSAEVETRYGGAFVQSVEGLEGDSQDGRSFDWFFAVNGIVAERGSTEFPVNAGDQIWWDYRDWTSAMDLGAVVGAFPAPLVGGYDNRDWPVLFECLDTRPACDLALQNLEAAGVNLDSVNGTLDDGSVKASPDEDALTIQVGSWDALKSTPAGERLGNGPAASGVFASFGPTDQSGRADLNGLDQEGNVVENFGPRAGLVAVTRTGDAPPVWLVTGGSPEGVAEAASGLNREDLQGRFAAVFDNGKTTSLPVP